MVTEGAVMKLKFIHTSDLHLGKKFDINNFSLKERQKRRQEIWDSFEEIIRTAKIRETQYLFIAGDLTEGDYISYRELNKISQNSAPFLILRSLSPAVKATPTTSTTCTNTLNGLITYT